LIILIIICTVILLFLFNTNKKGNELLKLTYVHLNYSYNTESIDGGIVTTTEIYTFDENGICINHRRSDKFENKEDYRRSLNDIDNAIMADKENEIYGLYNIDIDEKTIYWSTNIYNGKNKNDVLEEKSNIKNIIINIL